MKKIISFSLYGNDEKYYKGALQNIRLAEKYYPNWICRFYTDNLNYNKLVNVPDCEIELVTFDPMKTGKFWRMFPGFDSSTDICIIRDCDSRLNIRESTVVSIWETSKYSVHCMHDHKRHTAPIMGGMWGFKRNFISCDRFRCLVLDRMKSHITNIPSKRIGCLYGDQLFLKEKIFPLIKTSCCFHGDKGAPFTMKLKNNQFVGQQFTNDNKPIYVR